VVSKLLFERIMRLIVYIPCLYGSVVLAECLDQLINIPNVDILCLDNGAAPEVKKVLTEYRRTHRITVLHNKENEYVVKPWNDFIKHFLDSEYDYAILLNSDITLNQNWHTVVKSRWTRFPEEMLVPVISDDKTLMYQPTKICAKLEYPEVIPGVFISLNKEQAKAVYPIECQTKVWYSDNWIFEICKSLGYKVVQPDNLLAFHHASFNVQRVEGISAIIENDKDIWNEVGQYAVRDRINKLKQQ
jgi:hypothetical protein